jgi:hypothetical protein
LGIENWPDDICVGCDGASTLMSMTNFLTSKFNIIEKINKFMEELEVFLKRTLILIIDFLKVFHIF